MCLPSDALLQHLQSYLGFSYLGCGVSLHGYSSKVQALLLTFPTINARVFLFSIPSPAFIVCRLFDDGHSDCCEVILHWSLVLIFLIISDVEHFFHVFLGHLFGEISF